MSQQKHSAFRKVLPRVDSRAIKGVKGDLLLLEGVKQPRYAEIVNVVLGDGEIRTGQILEVSGSMAIVQVFEGTNNINPKETRIEFTGSPLKISVSEDMVGRILNSVGKPLDGGPFVLPEKMVRAEGRPVNPYMRAYPRGVIQTGISGIDLVSPIIMGTNMSIYSEPGVPYDKLTSQICRQAKIIVQEEEEDDNLVIIFAGIGMSGETAHYFTQEFLDSGISENTVMFLNLDTDSNIERIVTPQAALSTAEFFALEKKKQVLVVISDMRKYLNAVRESRWDQEETQMPLSVGTILSDLSKIYERAGRFHNEEGTITLISVVPVLNGICLEDDPLINASAFLDNGYLWLAGSLHRRGIYPPILPNSFARYYRVVIESWRSRRDWVGFTNQLPQQYFLAERANETKVVFGEEAMTDEDNLALAFSEIYEKNFLAQGAYENRNLAKSIALGWEVLRHFPFDSLRYFLLAQGFCYSQYNAPVVEKVDGIPVGRFMTFVQNNHLFLIKRERFYELPLPSRIEGQVPIHQAVIHGFLEIIEYLIIQGMDVDGVDEEGRTPLHIAASLGVVETLKSLVGLGAYPKIRDKEGFTPAELAEVSGQKECQEILIHLGRGVKRAH